MKPESGRRERWSERNSWREFQAGSCGQQTAARTHSVRAAACLRYLAAGAASVAFGALHAALDPVERFHARRRIDALGGKILDVDQVDPLQVGIVFGAAEARSTGSPDGHRQASSGSARRARAIRARSSPRPFRRWTASCRRSWPSPSRPRPSVRGSTV